MNFKCSLLALVYLGISAQVQAAAIGQTSVHELTKRSTADCPGYKLLDKVANDRGFMASLKLNGSPCNVYGNDIADLKLDVSLDREDRLHVHISDSAKKQFQIPESVLPLDKGTNYSDSRKGALKFDSFQDPKTGFGFKISRGGDVIFDTTGHPLIFEDQYIEVTSNIPSNANIYGIGETPDWFRRNTTNNIKALWSHEAASVPGRNIYGAHTVHMELRNGKFHGAYLHNSHGMDIVLANSTIQYRILGGTADFYFFNGPSALDVIDQYTRLVGRPNRIPYWALGFHSSRYGYKNIDEVNEVIANYSKAKIPVETQWMDLDYLDNKRDFTFDPVNFSLEKMQKLLKELHSRNQKMMLLTHAALQRNSSYGPYARGLAQDVFIKNPDGSNYVTHVWPGYSVMPDWFAPNANKWWGGELKQYLSQLPIDGIWLDMNEASTFCTGSCGTGRPEDEIPPYPWTVDPPPPHRPLNTSNPLLVPRYAIHNTETELSDATIETTAVHANGATQYSIHNIYGYMQSKATYDFLASHHPNKRPFLLSPSTFAGSGKYVSHWSGDNSATFFDLKMSISQLFDFGIFGIPLYGSDICGFEGDATEELCSRWAEVGAFYPFARNHYFIFSTPHEFYRWPKVAEAARRAFGIRYALLPYFYTAYQHAVEKGWPVARPLLFEFAGSTGTIDNDRQFLIGDGLLISPVLTEGATTVSAFFPKGVWYDWYSYAAVKGSDANITLDAPLEHVNVHVRGGKILPAQVPAMTTADSRKNDFYLIVAADENGSASGKLFSDDGETFNTPHRWVKFSYKNRVLSIEQESGWYTVAPPLSKIVLLGTSNVKNVRVNNKPVYASVTQTNGSTVIEGVKINLNTKSTISFN